MQKYFLILTLLLIVTIVACGKIGEPDYAEIPAKNVSFSEHLQPIFIRKCGTKFCHDTETSAGGIQLMSYLGVTAAGIVDKTSPETSILVLVINGSSPNQMPPIGATTAPMTKSQVEGVITWIREGAQDN